MTKKHRTRFYFFFSSYADMAFTRCPKCENKTKQRKLPLVICIEPEAMCVLNKTCRFCPFCELLIVRKSQVDPLVIGIFENPQCPIEQGDYTIVGTIDRADWLVGQKGQWFPEQVADHVWLFKNEWRFEIRGGWGPADDSP